MRKNGKVIRKTESIEKTIEKVITRLEILKDRKFELLESEREKLIDL